MQYALDGRVSKVSTTTDSAKAKVRGSVNYQVELWSEDDEAAFACTCPIGGEERFCKHAVAVALVVTDAVATEEAVTEQSEEIDLAAYLRGLDQEALVELLVERAAEDDIFDARLRMAAARTSVGGPALGPFREALEAAFETDGYVGYREAYDYTSGIDSVLDSLGQLLEDGHADAVVTLAEHAADLAEEALGYVDDSDGGMSGIAEHIRELHLAACEASRPDPVALARNLYDRERHGGDLEIFYGAAGTYADVLGDEGLAEYRRLAQQEWDELPPLGPDDERSWSAGRFRITQIMLTLADLTGDVDAVVAVLAHDQSSAYQFVKIAETLQGAQRHDEHWSGHCEAWRCTASVTTAWSSWSPTSTIAQGAPSGRSTSFGPPTLPSHASRRTNGWPSMPGGPGSGRTGTSRRSRCCASTSPRSHATGTARTTPPSLRFSCSTATRTRPGSRRGPVAAAAVNGSSSPACGRPSTLTTHCRSGGRRSTGRSRR